MTSDAPHRIHQQRWEWLNRDIQWLIISRAVRSIGQGYLGIILPLYLVALGYNAIALGTMFTVSAIVSAGLTLLISILADLSSRKLFVIIFSLLTAIASVVFVLTTNFAVLVIVAAIGTLAQNAGAGGIGGGPVYPAQQALITDFTKPQSRTVVFSAFSFVSTLVTTIGSLFASVPDILLHDFGFTRAASYQPLFLLTGMLALLAALTTVPVHEQHRQKSGSWRSRLLPRQSRDVIGKLAITNLLNGLGVGFFAPFISYWFYTRFGEGPTQIGLLFAAVNLGSALPYLIAPQLARILGVVRAVIAIRALGVVSLAALPFMPSFPIAAGLYFIRMTLQRASIPLRQSYTMGVVAESERSSAAGLSNLPSQIATTVSPLIAGYVFENISLELPFEIGTVFQLLNLITFWAFFRNAPLPEEADRIKRSPAITEPHRGQNIEPSPRHPAP